MVSGASRAGGAPPLHAHESRRVGSGQAHGTVTKRESDGLYAFVDIEARYDVQVEDPPDRTVMNELLESAERGCFVGNSLTAKPRYHWTVNGEDVR